MWRVLIFFMAGGFLAIVQLPPLIRAGLLEFAVAWSAPHLGPTISEGLQTLWIALLRSTPYMGSWFSSDISIALFYGVWIAQCLLINLALLLPIYLFLPPLATLTRLSQLGLLLLLGAILFGAFEFSSGTYLMPLAATLLLLSADRSRRLYLVPRNLR